MISEAEQRQEDERRLAEFLQELGCERVVVVGWGAQASIEDYFRTPHPLQDLPGFGRLRRDREVGYA